MPPELQGAHVARDLLDRLVSSRRLGLADDAVRLAPSDPEWADAFAAVRSLLLPAVDGARVVHIGSTSVPGLTAKPILDVGVGLSVGSSFGVAVATAIGLRFRAGNPESTLFALYGRAGLRVANVHVRYQETAAERWDILWRDYLRAHPQELSAYGEAKSTAAARHHDRGEYSTSKGQFIAAASGRVVAWAAHTGWAPPEVEAARTSSQGGPGLRSPRRRAGNGRSSLRPPQPAVFGRACSGARVRGARR